MAIEVNSDFVKNMFSLEGKMALVTGAAGALGGAVAMDSQAPDHPLHTAMGNNGMTRMNPLGAFGKPITEEYAEEFGEEAYAEFDKVRYIALHGKDAYDEKFGMLEEIGCWGTWEPCHKMMLGRGIVGVETLGGDIILNLTTSGGVNLKEEDRLRPFYELRPEMASFDCGTMNW